MFAVGVLSDNVLQLKSIGIPPNECCDALGYTLINLLTDHYPDDQALLWAE